MSELTKPSTPIVNGAQISVEPVTGAVRYNLYKIVYRLASNFVLADGSIIQTSDNKIFEVAENA